MEYAKDLIISLFNLILKNEPHGWAVGNLSQEDYFELRIEQPHHHCPCSVESAEEIIMYYTAKGIPTCRFHKPHSPGVILVKES